MPTVPSRDAMFALVHAAVRRVPRGRVATYGQIASMIGFPRHARLVGRALRALPDASPVPWHRIVNARGEISRRTRGDSDELQRILLESEGVAFDASGRVELERVRWEAPEGPR
jgi:methylated-DNA-protein-cysteine methyltransferase related protein